MKIGETRCCSSPSSLATQYCRQIRSEYGTCWKPTCSERHQSRPVRDELWRWPSRSHLQQNLRSSQEEDKSSDVCATIPDLFGDEVAEFKNVKLLVAGCCEVVTAILTKPEMSRVVTATLDTNAGPNLVCENVLSTTSLEKIWLARAN